MRLYPIKRRQIEAEFAVWCEKNGIDNTIANFLAYAQDMRWLNVNKILGDMFDIDVDIDTDCQ